MACRVWCATGVASLYYQSRTDNERGYIYTGNYRDLSNSKSYTFSVSLASGYTGYYISGYRTDGGEYVNLSSFPSSLTYYGSLTVGGVGGGGGGGGGTSGNWIAYRIKTSGSSYTVTFGGQLYGETKIRDFPKVTGYVPAWNAWRTYSKAIYGRDLPNSPTTPGYINRAPGASIDLNVTDDTYAFMLYNKAPYSITFNKNTNDDVSNMPSPNPMTGLYGNTQIPSTVPKRDGYRFDYWYNANGAQFAPNSIINVGENITLYAHWTQSTYYLTFSENTSDHVSQMPNPNPIERAGAGDVTIPSNTPLRDFYRFTGWNSKADGTGLWYQPGATFSLTVDSTLYAQWQRTYTYTITYKSNDGIFSAYAGRPEATSYPDTHTGTSSSFSIRILSSSDLNPARNGYTFSGWNDTASGTGQSFIGGNSYSFSGNYTLYAQWTPRTYTVTINPNGGYIGGSASSINVSKNYGETFSFSPYLPTRQYYDFEGWLSSGGVNKGGSDSYVVSGDETWTAQWSDIHSYKLTLYANYSGAPHISSEITRTGGTQISLSDYSANFVRDGYKLMGWDHDPNATPGTVDYAVDGTVTLSTNITLYAIWIKTYTVSYYSQGRLFATDYGDFISTIDNPGSGSGYLPNAYADVISLIPTWENHDFKGWANSSSATTPDYTSGQAHAIPVSGNVTLYAVWQWQPLEPFYWTGSYSGDLAVFQTGLPVSDAITAAGWNNLITKIDTLIQRVELSVSTSKPSYASPGMQITASLYNTMRGYIVAVLLQMNIGAAYFPPTVSTGDEITPYHFAFEGTNSLQGAVNRAISVFNNSLN